VRQEHTTVALLAAAVLRESHAETSRHSDIKMSIGSLPKAQVRHSGANIPSARCMVPRLTFGQLAILSIRTDCLKVQKGIFR
jgi:hypothetical protein